MSDPAAGHAPDGALSVLMVDRRTVLDVSDAALALPEHGGFACGLPAARHGGDGLR
jgi:hypothetical protein